MPADCYMLHALATMAFLISALSKNDALLLLLQYRLPSEQAHRSSQPSFSSDFLIIFDIRFCHRMFRHKNRTTVLERLDRCLISIQSSQKLLQSPVYQIRSADGIPASYILHWLPQGSALSGLPPDRYSHL